MNSQANERIAVIMAGGSGERFWPLSRCERPKQLLHLTSREETLLQEAVTRLLPLMNADQIYIATSAAMRDAIEAGDRRVPSRNILAEPCKRNTSGCLVWAAANAIARYGHEEVTMAVLTADHRIGEHDLFRRTIDAAMTAAEHYSSLVTIGVPPVRPDTGYGYIEIDQPQPVLPGFDNVSYYTVKRFREKPERRLAEEFCASGQFYWNSGMFFWRISTFVRQLREASPAMATALLEIAEALRHGDTDAARAAFERIENISIDYALLERARNVLVVRSLFPWDDVGSWDSLDRTFETDDHGNVAVGEPVLVDVKDSIVYNELPDEMAVAVIGLRNVVVVTTRDGVLVTTKDRAQEVRKAAEELKRRGAKQL